MKSVGNSQIFSQNRKFPVLYGWDTPWIFGSGWIFAEMTPEMGRSQPVRIQNTKFCNIPTIMKKVMDDRNPQKI